MAMKCPKCKGIIPDVTFGSGIDKNDCKNHIKPEIDFDLKHKIQG